MVRIGLCNVTYTVERASLKLGATLMRNPVKGTWIKRESKKQDKVQELTKKREDEREERGKERSGSKGKGKNGREKLKNSYT